MHGSAPCAPSLKREVMALFPPGAVWETYGGTETMGTVITPEEWLERPGSVGRPALGFDDQDPATTTATELPPGEIGLDLHRLGLGPRVPLRGDPTSSPSRSTAATSRRSATSGTSTRTATSTSSTGARTW